MPIVAVRAAGLAFGALNIDECDFLVGGAMLRDGLPYVSFVDNKPPLAYLFFAPASVLGLRLWPMQLLAMAWVFATSLVVGRAAREWLGREDAAWAGAWLACLVQCASMPAVNAETLLNLPAAAALLWFVRAARGGGLRAALACGGCIGLASLFKHQAGILLAALVPALALVRGGARRLAPAAVAGFALPWAAAAATYAALGHLREFVEWNFTRNLGYVAHGAGSPLARLAGALVAAVLLAAPLPWALAARETWRLRHPGARDPVRVGLALALWATAVPVALGGRFYEHYFLQFAPPLALLAVPGALALRDRWPALGVARRRLAAAALALPLAGYLVAAWGGGALGLLPMQEPRGRELGRWIAGHSQPGDRVFLWGHFSPIYIAAGRLPGTRYLHASEHVGNFDPHHLSDGFDLAPFVSERDVAATLADLDANRPEWFVDTTSADIHDWRRVPIRLVPSLVYYLHDHYRVAGHPAGAVVYRRVGSRSGAAGEHVLRSRPDDLPGG